MKKSKTYRKSSIQKKLGFFIAISMVILSIISVFTGYLVYTDTMNDKFIDIGKDITNIAAGYIDGDLANNYTYGSYSYSYLETKARLIQLCNSIPIISNIIVYNIDNSETNVVFDIKNSNGDSSYENSADLLSDENKLNDDPAILSDMLENKDIKPIITDNSSNWMLSIFSSVHDNNGNISCYVKTDISMVDILHDRQNYMLRLTVALLAITLICTFAVLYYSKKRVVNPINSISDLTSKFISDSNESLYARKNELFKLDIDTGDELENLYLSICKMSSSILDHISELSDKNAEIEKKAKTIERIQDKIIISFANIIENRDFTTGSHVIRTVSYVEAIVEEMKKDKKYSAVFTREYIRNLRRGAPLHDIGKVRIPDSILNKPGKLTPAEFEIIKTHATSGGIILREVLSGIESENYVSTAYDLAVYHHERWDGSGYPFGLAGDQIPLCARIMAVADVFDALITKRPYKEPYSCEKAFKIIETESGTHFDPDIVDKFLSIKDKIVNLQD